MSNTFRFVLIFVRTLTYTKDIAEAQDGCEYGYWEPYSVFS